MRQISHFFFILCSTIYQTSIMTAPALTYPVEFVILIASYNNEKFVIENLRSACFQKTTAPYKIIYVNDCSTDKTGDLVDQFIKEHKLESLVTVITNKVNVGQVANYFNTIHTIPDHKIIVTLDGDDMLASDTVLSTLERYYADPNVWMTYGSAIEYPTMKRIDWIHEVPQNIIKNKEFRKYQWVTSHLRSFRAALFNKIRKQDLSYKNAFIKYAGDLAFMFPMLEMCSPVNNCGVNHSTYIPEILYYYRKNNPISEFAIYKRPVMCMDKYIRAMNPYPSLEKLSDEISFAE
jgi:glycosyltransferase involved in cell wall biosynthesis